MSAVGKQRHERVKVPDRCGATRCMPITGAQHVAAAARARRSRVIDNSAVDPPIRRPFFSRHVLPLPSFSSRSIISRVVNIDIARSLSLSERDSGKDISERRK